MSEDIDNNIDDNIDDNTEENSNYNLHYIIALLLKSKEVRKFMSEINGTIRTTNKENNETKIKVSNIQKEIEIERKKPNILQLDHNGKVFDFYKRRLRKEIIIAMAILITIIILSLCDKLDNSTIGTLLGSVIGYTVGSYGSGYSDRKGNKN